MARIRDQDACPGALQVHRAADGALVRIRLPGGGLTSAQLDALAHTADAHGGGTLELTSRGSIQIRSVTDTAAAAAAIAAAGLLPSPSHERARNIVASPLSGRRGGLVDVRDWVDDLDAALCADPALAALPGRFWFSIDDGTADVCGLRADVGVRALDRGSVALLLSGADCGVRLPARDAVPAMVAVAGRFQQIRGTRWRIAELDEPQQVLADLAPVTSPGAAAPATVAAAAATRAPIGWITQDDARIALGAAVPLGVLPARTARFLAAISAPLAITPWRSVLVFDLDETTADASLRVLAPLGLVFDDTSPWLSVSACAGSPGCERSAADVRADATAAVTSGEPPVRHTHYVGCERACGSPPQATVLLATPDGYRELRQHP